MNDILCVYAVCSSDFTMCVRLVVTTGDDDDHSSNNISFFPFHTIGKLHFKKVLEFHDIVECECVRV